MFGRSMSKKTLGGFEIQSPKYGVLDMLDASKGESVGFSNTQEKFTSEKRSWGYHLELLTSWCISQKTGQLFGSGDSRRTSLSLGLPYFTHHLRNAGKKYLQVSLYCLANVDPYSGSWQSLCTTGFCFSSLNLSIRWSTYLKLSPGTTIIQQRVRTKVP